MKDQLRRVDAPKLAGADDFADAPHSLRVAIRKVDQKQAVGVARRGNHRLHLLCGAPQRLLAKHGGTAAQGADRLLRMQRARRRDHDTINSGVEQIIERCDDLCLRRQARRVHGCLR